MLRRCGAALGALILVLAAGTARAAERRCGWYQNPTPGNHWLIDREGMWIIAEQRGHQAEGLEDGPDLHAGEWVETNGHYGYGCVCLVMTVDRRSMRVTRLEQFEQMPLAHCRADPGLPRF